MGRKQLYVFLINKMRDSFNCGFIIEKSALCGFFLPSVGVSVAVEYYSLMLFYGSADNFV